MPDWTEVPPDSEEARQLEREESGGTGRFADAPSRMGMEGESAPDPVTPCCTIVTTRIIMTYVIPRPQDPTNDGDPIPVSDTCSKCPEHVHSPKGGPRSGEHAGFGSYIVVRGVQFRRATVILVAWYRRTSRIRHRVCDVHGTTFLGTTITWEKANEVKRYAAGATEWGGRDWGPCDESGWYVLGLPATKDGAETSISTTALAAGLLPGARQGKIALLDHAQLLPPVMAAIQASRRVSVEMRSEGDTRVLVFRAADERGAARDVARVRVVPAFVTVEAVEAARTPRAAGSSSAARGASARRRPARGRSRRAARRSR